VFLGCEKYKPQVLGINEAHGTGGNSNRLIRRISIRGIKAYLSSCATPAGFVSVAAMKLLPILVLAALVVFGLTVNHAGNGFEKKRLQHVVALKFKEGATPEQIREVEAAFAGLKLKIPQIAALEWGVNNSPEGLDKGFTHCFVLTYRSEKDREIYLVHPEHKAFVGILKPVLEDVLVIDYWARN
jgi:hypothetical protein